MYQPAHGRFVVDDPIGLLAELASAVPATLVTHGPGGFETSILPMLFDPTADEHGVLAGHLARPNAQWMTAAAAMEGGSEVEAIAIFTGAEAYVSPAWYEEKRRTGRVVPTWNYTTVVVRGSLLIHDDRDWLLAHVRRLVERHEAGREEPWSVDDAPAAYIEGQAKGIVGLELRIAGIEAKRKLSQNRSAEDIAGVIEGLTAGTPREQAVAADMRRDIAQE